MPVGNQEVQAASLMYVHNQQILFFEGWVFGFFLDYNNLEETD